MWFTLPDGGELLFDYEPCPKALGRAGNVRVILYQGPSLTGPQLTTAVETMQ
jgi:hypothetical protein